ncbi:ribosome assembly protein 4 [Pancytospora epiphaga]|nr:ribosome assembly protein 4 [Pancytospora epiphaga]
METVSLIQFENGDGTVISEVLQVPNTIELDQLKGLINTTQELYLNGVLITTTLESVMRRDQREDVEQIKKIRLSEDLPETRPALFCSSSYSGHEGSVLMTKFCGDLLVTAGADKTIRFWDLITKTQFNIVSKHSHWVLCLDVNEHYVVSGGMDKIINLYDRKGNHLRTLSRHRDGVTMVKLCGERVVSISRDKTCIVWGIDGTFVGSWSHHSSITALCVEKEYIITGGTDSSIQVHKSLKYHCNLKGHSGRVNCIAMSGKYIVSGDDSGAIIVWKDFILHKRVSHKREVISVDISPNGVSFATGSFDKTVRYWSIDSGESLGSYFHVNSVYKVRMFNDLIVSCSKDKTLKLFKVSKNKFVGDFACEDEIYDFDYVDGTFVCGTKSGKVYFFN